jgi:SAM-dependent methyltransferase
LREERKQYWDKRFCRSFDLEGVGYLGLGRQYNHWVYRVYRQVFYREVKKLQLSLTDVRILDVGSGTGFYINCWKEMGAFDIIGIDLSEVAVHKLESRFPDCRFYQLDIGESIEPIKDLQFDVISSLNVLFHIVDDSRYDRALYHIATLLKPGGYFIWSDNFLHGKTIRAQHQVSRSKQVIEESLEKYGLSILRRVPLNYFMNTPIDTENRWFMRGWKVLRWLIARGEVAGFIIGAFQFPLESLFTRYLKESPTTECMICRKSPNGQ